MKLNARLWRLALRIEATYRERRSRRPSLELPHWIWQRAVSAHERLAHCRRKGWARAGLEERNRLVSELDNLAAEIRSLRNMAMAEGPQLPKAADVYAELCGTADEFGGVSFEGSELYVTTEPIDLEGTYLGPFEIRLDLDQLHGSEPYRIVAVDPHPASTDSDVTHPHVRGEAACLGEARAPLRAALEEGRVADVFVLLDRLLHTYGRGSAYVELSRWDGTPCRDCDDIVDDDYATSCRGCDACLCGDCSRNCSDCGHDYCSHCSSTCPACEETTCLNCLTACEECGEEFCLSCLEKGVCNGCREAMEEEESETVEPADDTDASIHAAELGETALPA